MTTHIIEAPYGWRADADGKLVPDVAEQAVVARVCALRASGLSIRAIVAGLAMEGVRTCTAEEYLRDNGVKLGGAAGGASHGGDQLLFGQPAVRALASVPPAQWRAADRRRGRRAPLVAARGMPARTAWSMMSERVACAAGSRSSGSSPV